MSHRRLTREEREEIGRLHRAGITIRELCDRFRRSETTIKNWARVFRTDSERPQPVEDRAARARRMRAENAARQARYYGAAL